MKKKNPTKICNIWFSRHELKLSVKQSTGSADVQFVPGAPGTVRDLGTKEKRTCVLASERRTWFSSTQPLL